MKILLVEDDRKSAELFSLILQTEGFEVVHTEYGIKGLQLARQEEFAAIILDINLPDLDGKTIGLALRRTLPTTPIIALTAQADSITRQLTQRYGFNAFIAKPCTDEDLVNTIRILTQAKRNSQK